MNTSASDAKATDTAKTNIVTIEYLDAKPPRVLHTSFSEKLLTKSRKRPPRASKPKSSSYQITTLLLDPRDPQFFKNYLVNQYARPHALVGLTKNKEEAEPPGQQSQEVRQFLGRFDGKRDTELPPRSRKGFNGWKLTHGKGGKKSLGRKEGEDGEKKQPIEDNLLGNEILRSDEPPIGYIQWKHSIDDFS